LLAYYIIIKTIDRGMNKKLKILFKELNNKYWRGELPIINLVLSSVLDDDTLGEYFCPLNQYDDSLNKYCIKINKKLSKHQLRDTLLHEMVHHSQFLKNKEKYWKNRLSWHGTFWKKEMRRVGFTGKINKFT
jgi:hypothetical protein